MSCDGSNWTFFRLRIDLVIDSRTRSMDLMRWLAAKKLRGVAQCLAVAALVVSSLGLAGCNLIRSDKPELLVLVRRGDATSRAIADDFAARRELPKDRILELTLSTPPEAKVISAALYQREIAMAIDRYLRLEDASNRISHLITTRGLPLQIEHCQRDEISGRSTCRRTPVDAALAQLERGISKQANSADPADATVTPSTPSEPATPSATEDAAPTVSTVPSEPVANPFFRDARSFLEYRREEPESALRFLVARLTSPLGQGQRAGDVPKALSAALDLRSSNAESDSSEAATEDSTTALGLRFRVDVPIAPASRSVAATALLSPVQEQLTLLGHRVCDRCPESEALEPSHGVVLQSKVGSTDAQPPALSYPGLVINIAPVSTSPSDSGRQKDVSAFDRFVEFWLNRGAGALSLHLDDLTVGDATRPVEQFRAIASGETAVEAHFKSLPRLGGSHIFVGDPLLALAVTPSESDRSMQNDRDADGIEDIADNCPNDHNPDQRDTNGDGFGNLCDADVDNDGWVDTSRGAIYPLDTRGDLEAIILTATNGPYDPDHDLDGDARVDERDLVIARLALFRPPGR